MHPLSGPESHPLLSCYPTGLRSFLSWAGFPGLKQEGPGTVSQQIRLCVTWAHTCSHREVTPHPKFPPRTPSFSPPRAPDQTAACCSPGAQHPAHHLLGLRGQECEHRHPSTTGHAAARDRHAPGPWVTFCAGFRGVALRPAMCCGSESSQAQAQEWPSGTASEHFRECVTVLWSFLWCLNSARCLGPRVSHLCSSSGEPGAEAGWGFPHCGADRNRRVSPAASCLPLRKRSGSV